MKLKLFLGTLFFLAGLLLFPAGCSTPENNYLRSVDFARHLESRGIKVTSVKPLDPAPVGASEAVEIKIGPSCIGVYKLDRSSKHARERLERVQKSRRVYFNGIPYPVYEVYGSFFLVGLDKHPQKKEILEALRQFR